MDGIRKSFVFYQDWFEMLRDLDKDSKVELYDAIASVGLGYGMPELSPASKLVMKLIESKIERDRERWGEISRKRKEVGRLGGLSKSKQKLPIATNCYQLQANDSKTKQNKQTLASVADNVNDNVNDNVSVNDNEEKDFIEKVYKMYPAKCPVRNTYLGKCSKDKDRIRKLLKTYSKEDIEKVVTHEVDEKFGKSMMQNFSTFLNNFPDPNSLFSDNVGGSLAYPKSVEDIKEDDIQPTYPFFVDWLEKNCRNLLDNIRGGYPKNNGQYKRLAECTKGGTKGVAYVCLVLNRDGWDKYYDEQGFMWIYSNYIKANGLFVG